MKTLVLGAGIIGISTAWHLLERGHEVTVVDRQPDAALETSFANGAQISVSYCEPWANRHAPAKLVKWLLRDDAPLLFRPRLDWQQWRWGLQFLGQCTDAVFERNVQQLVALGAYSHAALKDVVAATGIDYHRLERGIAHFYTHTAAFDDAAAAAELMQKHGVDRKVVSREELFAIEPAFRRFDRIVGGTYTASDESGDARVFTQQLARLCAARGRFCQDMRAGLRADFVGDGPGVPHVGGRDAQLGVGLQGALHLGVKPGVVVQRPPWLDHGVRAEGVAGCLRQGALRGGTPGRRRVGKVIVGADGGAGGQGHQHESADRRGPAPPSWMNAGAQAQGGHGRVPEADAAASAEPASRRLGECRDTVAVRPAMRRKSGGTSSSAMRPCTSSARCRPTRPTAWTMWA